jgi:hypothetical protein
LNSATSSKDLFAIFILCFCPIFWLRDINVYLVSSVFTSRPTSLPASNTASVFLLTANIVRGTAAISCYDKWSMFTNRSPGTPSLYLHISVSNS